MKESKTSVFFEYQERFENMGHRLILDNAAFREIARMAVERKTGARGLANIFNDLYLRQCMCFPVLRNLQNVYCGDATLKANVRLSYGN